MLFVLDIVAIAMMCVCAISILVALIMLVIKQRDWATVVVIMFILCLIYAVIRPALVEDVGRDTRKQQVERVE